MKKLNQERIKILAKARTIEKCPCCGSAQFIENKILWPKLIKEWRLTKPEAKYINRQQGLYCVNCGSNLRSMSLAYAIMRICNYNGLFRDYVKNDKSKILEINEAGHLNQYLGRMRGRVLAEYPDIDLMKMKYANSSFDMVVHSDTLEHVSNPVQALRETLRILREGGATCFTVPIVVGRLTSKRKKTNPSYHGTPGLVDYLVQSEYGADIWTQLMDAGFIECRLYSIDFPASIVVAGIKQ